MRGLARSGVTLIEVAVVLVIVAVLAAVGVPSLREFMMQQRLKSAAAELLTDIQFARSAALSMGSFPTYVNVTFRSNASMTCYSIAIVSSKATNCDCTRANNICRVGLFVETTPLLRIVKVERSTGITVASPSQMLLNFSGMAEDPADRVERTLTVTASTGATLKVIIGATGFPRLCAPAGTNISGVPACV